MEFGFGKSTYNDEIDFMVSEFKCALKRVRKRVLRYFFIVLVALLFLMILQAFMIRFKIIVIVILTITLMIFIEIVGIGFELFKSMHSLSNTNNTIIDSFSSVAEIDYIFSKYYDNWCIFNTLRSSKITDWSLKEDCLSFELSSGENVSFKRNDFILCYIEDFDVPTLVLNSGLLYLHYKKNIAST